MTAADHRSRNQIAAGVRRIRSPHGTSLASVESLSMPLVQEVVISADIGCAECQKRVADIISKMNETDSVMVSVLDKKVTLTCRYDPNTDRVPTTKQISTYKNPVSKVDMIKRVIRYSFG